MEEEGGEGGSGIEKCLNVVVEKGKKGTKVNSGEDMVKPCMREDFMCVEWGRCSAVLSDASHDCPNEVRCRH